jgi:hypothetical protein
MLQFKLSTSGLIRTHQILFYIGISTVCDYSRHFLFGHPNSSVQTPGQSTLFVFWQKAEQRPE